MLVFGGSTGAASLGDTRELSLTGTPTWNLLSPSGTPPHARVPAGAFSVDGSTSDLAGT